MWHRRLSWSLRPWIAVFLLISLWLIYNNLPHCIHCRNSFPGAISTHDSIELETCFKDSSTGGQSAFLPSQDEPRHPLVSNSHSDPSIQHLPQDYVLATEESTFCENRFGIPYLESLRKSATKYCTTDSPSDLTCFHSQTLKGRVDSLCIGQNAIYDPTIDKFRLGCALEMLPESPQPFLIPEYGTFQKYMFETGPRVVMDNWIELDNALEASGPGTSKYTILVKREGPSNIWHGLLEIFSVALTMDILEMSQVASDLRHFFTPLDVLNTQVVLLDDYEEGPLFELWSIFGNRPVRRLKDLTSETQFENLILPLAGGSNPLWQSNPPREGAPCERSALLRTFSRRVLNHYNIQQQPRRGANVTVTFIDRSETRVLLNHTSYLDNLQVSFPDITILEVDFARISFKEQLDILQQTDLLVGVHGAGLTNAMFLPPRSTVVELLPAQVDYKAYENLASLSGHSYFSLRCARNLDNSSDVDWHRQHVSLDREAFMDLMTVALKAFYNKSSQHHED